MIEHTKGSCDGEYSKEGGKAETDPIECNSRCLADSTCHYASFASGHQCWLFQDKKCKISESSFETTYKKGKHSSVPNKRRVLIIEGDQYKF